MSATDHVGEGVQSSTPRAGADLRATPPPVLSMRVEVIKRLTLAILREVDALTAKAGAARPEPQRSGAQFTSLQDEVRSFESRLIRGALASTGGHQGRAARLLGVKATTLHTKIKRYGIDPSLPTADPGDFTFDARR